MITTKDKLEFVYAMAKHSGATLADMQRLLRWAATYQRLAETACNRELEPKEEKRKENARKAISERLRHFSCKATFQGDPRGCCVKIQVPDGYTNDWGKEGICVPA